jgi:hypothetical protein
VPAPPDGTEKVDDKFDAGGFFTPKVDILFVVDNSGSMDGHQKDLVKNFDLFLKEFSSSSLIDYRIGVTTTDSDINGGTLISTPGVGNYVDKKTPGGMQTLKSRLLVGTGSTTSYEQMFNPGWRAFNPPLLNGKNAGFLRQDAFLAVVFITDAEDQSSETSPHLSGDDLIQFLDSLKGAGHWFSYGAFVPPGHLPAGCERDEPSTPADDLLDFMKKTASPYFSLCSPDFGKNLAAIGSNLVSKVGRTLFLDRFPIVETIKITYGTQVIPPNYKTGWFYTPSQNSITFGEDLKLSAQPANTQIKITFTTKH